MIELVYVSTAQPGMKDDDIKDILKTARKFNTANQISGCLLFHNNQFVQILEGEEGVVADLYSNIAKDDRHTDLLLLTKGEIEERVFPNWSMAFHELKSDNLNDFSKQNFESNMVAFSDLANKPTEAVHVFWSFVKRIVEED